MAIDITKLNHEVAVRYSTAGTLRAVLRAMGHEYDPEWQDKYDQEYPPKKRNDTNRRCFEADHRVELGAPDTEAPHLIDAHLSSAKRDGLCFINQICQETRMRLPGGSKIKNIQRRLRNIPETLRDRVTPVTHIAQKEIDLENVFGVEYDRLQANYERDIDHVMHHYECSLSSTKLSQSAKKRLRDETFKELERIARAHWNHFEEWIDQAMHYLTGKQMIVEPASA